MKKNSKNQNGFDLAMSLGSSQEIVPVMLGSAQDILNRILDAEKSISKDLDNAVDLIVHSIRLIEKQDEYTQDLLEENIELTKKLKENGKSIK